METTQQSSAQIELMAEKERFCSATLSRNTLKSYEMGWNRFVIWCDSAGRSSLPAVDETIALWVTSMLGEGLSLSTVNAWIGGLAYYHREAGFDRPTTKETRRVINGARRLRHERPEGKRPITVDQLWKISRLQDSTCLRGVRNRAILLLGFASAMRRSELAGLDLSDLTFVPKGIVLRLRWSKTDQNGEGRDIGVWRGHSIDTCPVRAVQAWLDWRGNQPGPLFYRVNGAGQAIIGERLGYDGVARVVKEGVRSIGLDPALYGGHSLRSGYCTAGAENGASIVAIMHQTGHRTVDMVKRYFRPVSPFSVNPLSGKL